MPITNDLFQELLVFEERYHQGSDKYDVIQKLIDLYAVLIEHYDSIQDPVGYYFNEKLQSLFACQRALKTIRKTNQEPVVIVPQITQSLIIQETTTIQNSQESQKAKQVICVESKKRERQTRAKIAMEVQDQIDGSQQNLEHLINGYQKASDQTQSIIEEQLKKQDETFQQRRLKREQSNIMRKSSRLCSTKCSTDRFEVLDSCIEFSSGPTEREVNNPRLVALLREQSAKISSENTQTQEIVQIEDVQPFEEVQIEEMDETETIIPPRKQIREESAEYITDTPPQKNFRPKQFGVLDNNGDLQMEDEQNLISDLNIELN